MKENKKKRINICLNQTTIDRGNENAKKLGISFSSYIATLINSDKKVK